MDTRDKILAEVQEWIDNNNVYQVEFGHYEDGYKWVPLKTKRINLREVFKCDSLHTTVNSAQNAQGRQS